jgi:hypothetical protein
MRSYDDLPEALQEILANTAIVIDALEKYGQNPIPSKQLQLDVHLSGLEIRMTNIAKEIREKLL